MTNGHDIAMALRAAYLAMHRRTNRRLARHGMTADQFVILALLAEEDGLTQQDLVCRASSDPNTLRAMLVLLENRGCVARRPHPTDGRARSVTLTRKGRLVFDQLSQAIKPVQDQLRRVLNDETAQMLTAALHEIVAAMAQTSGRDSQPQAKALAVNSKS